MSNVLTIICVLRPLQICLPSKIIPVLWSVVIHPGVSPITDILSGIETCTSNGWGWRRGTRRSCPTTREYVRSILSRKTFNRTLKEGGLSLLLYVLWYLEISGKFIVTQVIYNLQARSWWCLNSKVHFYIGKLVIALLKTYPISINLRHVNLFSFD